MNQGFRRNLIAYFIAGCWSASAVMSELTSAVAQELTTAPPVAWTAVQLKPQDRAENTGDDFDRPTNLFQTMYAYRTAPGAGATRSTIREVTTNTINLRMDHRIDLDPQWRVGLRADLALLAKNPLSSDNPTGDFRYGMGGRRFAGRANPQSQRALDRRIWSSNCGTHGRRRPRQRQVANHAGLRGALRVAGDQRE